MVITVSGQTKSAAGPRPINLNRDIPQVIKLLEMVFGKALGGRLLGAGLDVDNAPSLLWRLNPGASKLALGYVFEVNGEIVGNATVLTTNVRGRYLVVNVAVHPDFRHMGIARQLMGSVMAMVRARHGREILLQVEHDNEAALNLYRSLKFSDIGTVTAWYAPSSRLREIPASTGDDGTRFIRELRRQEWQEAYELDLTAHPPDLNWPDSLPTDAYRQGLVRWFENVLSGRRFETWVISGGNRSLAGLASIWSEWAGPHKANLRVHPDWRGQLERPLLAKLIRRLGHLPRRETRFDHPDEDELVTQLLREANFRPRRTLCHMRLDL